MLRCKTETRPGLVALYDIRPGNGAGQFLQPQSPHGAASVQCLRLLLALFLIFFLLNKSKLLLVVVIVVMVLVVVCFSCGSTTKWKRWIFSHFEIRASDWVDFMCAVERTIDWRFSSLNIVGTFLHCALAAVQCIVIGPVCLWVGGCACLCVDGSIDMITRNCVHGSSPNWYCR